MGEVSAASDESASSGTAAWGSESKQLLPTGLPQLPILVQGEREATKAGHGSTRAPRRSTHSSRLKSRKPGKKRSKEKKVEMGLQVTPKKRRNL